MFANQNFIQLASKFKFFSHNSPDDFADKLSYKYSCFILIIFCITIVCIQYGYTPISCSLANDPSKDIDIDYLEQYCWVTGTIPITYEGKIPTTQQEFDLLEKKKILYYHWVPQILGIQALLCYLPQIIWRLFYQSNARSDLRHLIVKASKASNMYNDDRSKEVEHLSKTLETLLFQETEDDTNSGTIQKIISKINNLVRLGAHLMIFYLFVKILYLVNSIGQIFLMKKYLKLDNYTAFGWEILQNVVAGKGWNHTLVFPREAFCFGKVRHLGAVNYIVAQCALPLNMLNEKFYVFFFFWMILVSIATNISILVWISGVVVKNCGHSFVKKYLELNNEYRSGDKFNKRIRKFEIHFLRSNGLFILQMLATNCGEIITAEVVCQLWKTYKTKYEKGNNDSVDDATVMKPDFVHKEEPNNDDNDWKEDLRNFERSKSCDTNKFMHTAL